MNPRTSRVALLAMLVASLAGCSSSTPKVKAGPTHGPSATPSLSEVSPKDGDLQVMSGATPVKLAQLKGSCTEQSSAPAPAAGSPAPSQPTAKSAAPAPKATPKTSGGGQTCRYEPIGQPPVVERAPGTLDVKAGSSTTFTTSVQPLPPLKPRAALEVTIAGSTLKFPKAPMGSYRITLLGNQGGAWQFVLKVTK